jgi:hypothetical protein
MQFVNAVVALIIAGLALCLINNYIPMASSIKTLLNIVVLFAVGVWLLIVAGLAVLLLGLLLAPWTGWIVFLILMAELPTGWIKGSMLGATPPMA